MRRTDLDRLHVGRDLEGVAAGVDPAFVRVLGHETDHEGLALRDLVELLLVAHLVPDRVRRDRIRIGVDGETLGGHGHLEDGDALRLRGDRVHDRREEEGREEDEELSEPAGVHGASVLVGGSRSLPRSSANFW
ncbi:MAG: hypothetical protein AB200_00200 [Parcubacteria bacterium C7867-005]|nr:MAG: hypothetical protein AB200_00200 [Parcubacteria bacterium C7867-005]